MSSITHNTLTHSQPTLLVTGGTGLLGSHLLFHLTKKGQRVRAIFRKEESIRHVGYCFRLWGADESLFSSIEWIQADVTDIPAMEKAFEGIEQVVHTAGLVSFSPDDFDELIKINVEGTANVANLCIAHGIKRLCYVSSVAVLGREKNGFSDESSEWNSEENHNDYAISKHGGETEIWRASQEGVEVVIVNPSVIIGSGFWDSGSGLMFQKVAQKLRFYTTGGTGFVDASDVALAITMLLQSDIKNQRFVLNAENQTYQFVLSAIAKNLDIAPPSIKIRYGWLRFFAIIDHFLGTLHFKKRQLSKQSAQSLSRISGYDGSLITRTIDFRYTDLQASIRRVCEDFRKSNM